MNLLVDTSVWSLGLRRDVESQLPQVQALREALLGDEIVVTTGLVAVFRAPVLNGGSHVHGSCVSRIDRAVPVATDR